MELLREILHFIFYSYTMAVVFHIGLAVCVTVHVLLYKTNVYSSIGWIGLAWFSPVFGGIIYIIFGINRIRMKAAELKENNGKASFKMVSEKELKEYLKTIPDYIVPLARLGLHVHPVREVSGNNIELLINGDQAYPEMAGAISKAKKDVLLSSYIFDYDNAGKIFVDAIKKACSNGAKIYILIDAVGNSKYNSKLGRIFKKLKNVNFVKFLPPNIPISLPFINLRTHRKILIVDGNTAFFGGMNIRGKCMLKDNPKNPTRDITFKVSGPVIDQIREIFVEDWYFSAKQNIRPSYYDEKANPSFAAYARVIPDGPESEEEKIMTVCLAGLNYANKKINIITPYFLPTEIILKAIEMAAMRGVEVNIILPRSSNHKIIEWGGEANYARLLKHNVNIYLTGAPFDHSKAMTVDGVWSFIGSSNWDERSFKLNFEANMEVVCYKLAKQIDDYLKDRINNAEKIKFTDYDKMPLLRKLRNNACRLATPYF
ncbi:Phosphatidylglycerophosphate synthase [Elusimicrobium minutum Pei191]|uniref:Phosphatidylglycerophosphate synthase n=1 Tax=Elusimicrobium minutum (strain Pei191) TaxID=445932 RepID=B2KB74_ELUMP|nr:phospholipase D-like domain-containing protein [Elusimicrobium minutum]ACC97896.1 Phosphatidylglycerophosphate synthase [Elusimicrobium minutum Pei191]